LEADPYPGDEVVLQRIREAELIKEALLRDERTHFVRKGHCRTCPSKDFCPAVGPDPAQHKRDLLAWVKQARPMVEVEIGGLAA
jgi:hypothetical protein